MTSPLPSDEVAEDYKNSLEDLTLNSKYEISNLTVIAKENVDHALAIARVLENHIRTAPPNRKLPALYVLDSVVKNVGTPYTLFFGRNLYQTFMNAYTLVDGPVRKKLEEMLKTWKEPVPGSLDSRPVFPVDVTRTIENALIKARTAAVQLQQQQAKGQPGRAGIPYGGRSTPPNAPPGSRPGDRNVQQQPQLAPQGYHPQQGQAPYGPAPPLNGAGPPINNAQPMPYQQYPAAQPTPPPFPQAGVYPQPSDSIDALNLDIANLISSARIEFASNPFDQGIQERLKALLDLQSILRSQTLPPDQLRLIKDQVGQLSLASRPPQYSTSPAAPPAVQQPPPLPLPPQQQPPLQTLFPPNALAALLASVAPAQQPTPPPPQPALPVSHPPNLFTQPLSIGTPPPAPIASPAGGESSLLASLRAAGMLAPVASTPTATPALPANLLSSLPQPPRPSPPNTYTVANGPSSRTRPALAAIPNDVDMTSTSIKMPRPHLISTLYEAQPNQCTICGRRFLATDEGRSKKASHLDWHFRVNLRMADAAKRGQNRSWYVDEMDWIRSRDNDEEITSDPYQAAANSNATASEPSRAAKKQWIPVPNDPTKAKAHCPICQEKFETVWHDEAQEWVWMDAVQVGDKIYHASCHAEVTKDGSGPPAPGPVLGKRKAEGRIILPAAMHFEQNLKNTIYGPWRSHYIDYAKLKKLLREPDDGQEDESPAKQGRSDDDWTEDDEGAFVEELVNVQLDKVNDFQVETSKQLRGRTSRCESELEDWVAAGDKKEEAAEAKPVEKERQEKLQKVLKELDDITKETNELEKFSRINFTGFLKAAKKHDRKRGLKYRVRPLLQVRLGALPFNSEDYSPLLYRLSAMYSFVRQNLGDSGMDKTQSATETVSEVKKYTSHKFWVHRDNLLEVKIRILRRLPVLVYNPQTSKVVEGVDADPTITSLYFDNSKFSLYTQKVDREPNASSLRLRWYGQLNQNPTIFFEKKTVKEDDTSEEIRFPIKEKYVQSFIKGEYKMEKTVQKLQDRQGQSKEDVERFEKHVEEIQGLIREYQLQPMLRANYARTAFQIPGDDSVRISLDTNLALIREDALDTEKPCRDPEDWHRTRIDATEMAYPFVRVGLPEINRFPFALLEIKVREGAQRRSDEWLQDLMVSHLVKEAPRFSKFVHGVAQLFEDYVNSFPFWLSDVDSDIRKDPGTAFEEEQEKKARRAEDEFAVGSFAGSFKHPTGSPAVKARKPSAMLEPSPRPSPRASPQRPSQALKKSPPGTPSPALPSPQAAPRTGLTSLFPTLSTSKYARRHQGPTASLPPGLHHPGPALKNAGPVRVEPKVWLANQRTFVKWQHVSVLLASLAIGLFNAAGADNTTARVLAGVYTAVAIFAGAWGWAMYLLRSRWIKARSGRDFDNALGPVVVCLGLTVALAVNFFFKYRAVVEGNPLGAGEGEWNETALRVAAAGSARQAVLVDA
ncbi:MAG: Phosphate metabolism transcription protein [Thelocarpon impressellum]|nr:MAG: Phosphate metabolism transcription protein [Thelocarpon impressellum]